MNSTPEPPLRPKPVVTRRLVSGSTLVGLVMLVLLVGIAWRASTAAWFLFFPVLLVGVLASAAMAVLWGLRHF